MTDEAPSVAAPAAAPPPPPRPSLLRRHWGKLTLLTIVLVPLTGMSLWLGVTLGYTYSEGTRTGFVQKLSNKGWLCKTWEGELAMTTVPGTAPQIFNFSVRSDSVAAEIEKTAGSQVTLYYKEHRGVPTSCFGETQYFVDGVRGTK
ncbi:MAG: hypothetical protein P3B98_00745 [Gemmatimonadota bacterium]|nr:hypothetical protein [Gemmatimonadota bacterium]